jgi:REP element-mobilizing transposase RayT
MSAWSSSSRRKWQDEEVQGIDTKHEILVANEHACAYMSCMRRQGAFDFRTWGGKRKGAGRKGVAAAAGGASAARARESAASDVMYGAIREAVARATKWLYHDEAESFRIVHASVQGNHLHLLVEAGSNQALTRGMKGFLVSCAKRLNAIAGRRGQVFADRFHSASLATPRQVRNALAYLLGNWRKHGEAREGERIDRYSSAFALPDWSASETVVLREVPMLLPVALPRTWLLAEGWRRAGAISPWTRPGPA